MFVHLRLHTEFSVVDGTCRINDVINAAAADSQPALADYQGVPASQEALDILVNSYDKLGMNDLRDDAKRVREANFANAPDATKTTQKKGPWWKLW